MIKKLASRGGDTLVGRVHGGLETEYIPQFLPIILANALPKIKPYDNAVNNRFRVGTFEKTFAENPKNEYELETQESRVHFNAMKTYSACSLSESAS